MSSSLCRFNGAGLSGPQNCGPQRCDLLLFVDFIRSAPAMARPSPQRLMRLPALEQWEHIACSPELTRSWFTCSLAWDIVMTAVVFMLGWISVGSPLLNLVPCVGYAVLAGGVLMAVSLHGPMPRAAMLCPAQSLLKIYFAIYPLSQSLKNVCSIPCAFGVNNGCSVTLS